jgi:hypothetical protein
VTVGTKPDEASEFEEDNGAVMAEDPNDQTFEPSKLEVGPHVVQILLKGVKRDLLRNLKRLAMVQKELRMVE